MRLINNILNPKIDKRNCHTSSLEVEQDVISHNENKTQKFI
jgi:hypothetical protein